MNKINAKNSVFFCLFLLFFLFFQSAHASEEMIFNPAMEDDDKAQNSKFFKMHYDETTFDLAYKTFVYNGNVKDAFALSLVAVQHNPKSLLWHERLLQTAIWTNHVNLVIKELTYLVEKENQTKYMAQAIKITKGLHKYDQLIPLLEYQYQHKPNDPQAVIDLAVAYNEVGEMEKSIQFLRRNNHKNPNILYLLKIASIYRNFCLYSEESKILKEINMQYGVTVETAMLQAEIDYNNAHPRAALNALLAAPKGVINDANYWNTQAQLGWLLGAEGVARNAYLKLYDLDQLDEDSMEQLLLLQPKKAARQTLKIALNGWQKYHNIDMFLKAVEVAINLKDFQALHSLYNLQTPSTAYIQLSKKADYWNGKVFILQHEGQQKLARNLLLSAVLSQPNNSELALLYNNFLVDQLSFLLPEQQPEYLRTALIAWQNKAVTNDEWADVCVRGLMLFDEPKVALKVYQKEYAKQTHDYGWYNNYAGVLEQLSYDKSAYNERLFNWHQIQKNLAFHSVDDYSFWYSYDELVGYFGPVNVAYGLSSYLADKDTSQGGADGLLAWAFANNKYELAAYLIAYYYPDGIPAGFALKFALLQNNHAQLKKLVTTMAPVLPRKERVEAAKQIHDIPLAQTLAFEGLQNSSDADQYKTMTELFLQTANSVSVSTEFEQFGNLQGPREILKGKFFVNNQLSLSPYTKFWDARSNNSGDLGSRSYAQKKVGLIVSDVTDPNSIDLDISQTHALYGYTSIKLYGQYVASNQLTISGTLGYNLYSTLDTFMLAGGMQNEAIGTVSYDLTAYDKIVSTIELDRYYLQNRTALGNGTLLSGEYDHKLWLEYPDFTLQLNGSINRFNHYYPAITGTILEVIPTSVPLTASNLLVKNFWQVGFNFIFGDAVRQEYTQAWRPYANMGVLFASTSGLGTDLDVGIAGSVAGRDKLSLYFTRSTTNQGKSQINFLAGLSYQIYI